MVPPSGSTAGGSSGAPPGRPLKQQQGEQAPSTSISTDTAPSTATTTTTTTTNNTATTTTTAAAADSAERNGTVGSPDAVTGADTAPRFFTKYGTVVRTAAAGGLGALALAPGDLGMAAPAPHRTTPRRLICLTADRTPQPGKC
ncbi:hypothetical protein PLESTB_001736600 [Pleodorina starrii]|uniref:Uncharacterized protein n=1 Tax=Pleodorina starrii TaxID=330485 RepID=A0A9W6F9C6_9CHLO|nr:hypothetical protein PLESTB_001736600 [Pleodorina starrii]